MQHDRIVDLLHTRGTIDTDNLAIDPVTILGCQEADNTGNVEGLANTAARRPGSRVLVDLVVGEGCTFRNVLSADSVVHVGLDATRCDAVNRDFLLTSICGAVSDVPEVCDHVEPYR
jgi:hypothetical protein